MEDAPAEAVRNLGYDRLEAPGAVDASRRVRATPADSAQRVEQRGQVDFSRAAIDSSTVRASKGGPYGQEPDGPSEGGSQASSSRRQKGQLETSRKKRGVTIAATAIVNLNVTSAGSAARKTRKAPAFRESGGLQPPSPLWRREAPVFRLHFFAKQGLLDALVQNAPAKHGSPRSAGARSPKIARDGDRWGWILSNPGERSRGCPRPAAAIGIPRSSGSPAGRPAGPPRIRTCATHASGSSGVGLATFVTNPLAQSSSELPVISAPLRLPHQFCYPLAFR